MRKYILLSLLAVAFSPTKHIQAQAVTIVSFDSGNQFLYADATKTTLLSAGNVSTAFDGAMLQFGYYTAATSGNPFAGDFVSLAGMGSANTSFGNISIGDNPNDAAGNGTFALTLTFNSTTLGSNVLPPSNQQLAIQFYNGTTLANSTAYNVVSDAAWLFPAPSTPAAALGISLDQANLVFLGGTNSAFYTSQPIGSIPEPSTYVLVLGGLGVFACLARRHGVANV